MNTARALGVVVLVATGLARAAAPPVTAPVRLTAEQQKHVDALAARAGNAAENGDFEGAAKLLSQVVEFRAERQGWRHWQTNDAAMLADEWRRLARGPQKDRTAVLHAKSLNGEATRLLGQGRYREAEGKAREAVAVAEKALGPDHPTTAGSYNNVAYCMQAQGKGSEALPLYRRALAAREKALGPDHPTTAASYNNVAYCLEKLGKAAEALPIHRRALAATVKALGPDHPDTAGSYNNVAGCLMSLGKAADALPLYRMSLRANEKALGTDHPDTAASYNNLASCLKSLGKASEALPLFRRALLAREKGLGPDHPDTAASYNNVASCLEKLGKAAEALPLFRRALAAFEKTLGPDHPNTAASYNGVAACLESLGKGSEALPLYRRALAAREKALGPDHPDTAGSYNNVAGCLMSLGKAADALPLVRRSLAAREKTLGPDHPDTAASYNNVAYCLLSQNRVSEALPLYRRAFRATETALGPDHPHTATSYNNAAYCLQTLGKASEALPLYRRALAAREKMLGHDHPQTAASCNNVAHCLLSLGQASDALPLFRRALEASEKALGPNHPTTAQSYTNLAGCLFMLKEYAEAARAFSSAVAGREFGRLNAGTSGFDRSLFQANLISPRLGLAACLVRQGKPAEAWAQAEADLARGLLEDLDPDRAAEDRGRLAQVEAINSRLLPLLTRADLPDADRTERDDLLEQRRRVETEFATAAVARADGRTVGLARVRKQIPTDAAIVLWIDFDPLGEHLGCVLRREGEPAWVRLPGSSTGGSWSSDDDSLTDRVQQALQTAGDAAERGRLLAALSRQRVAPLEKHLVGAKKLLVVPTGRMAEVPVEALTDRYTVSYVPSASVLARAAERHRPLAAGPLLLLADPAFSAQAPPDPPPAGVLLTAVVPGGPAARAGLRPGDVLLRVGDAKVESLDDLGAALKQPLPLRVIAWRDGGDRRCRLTEGGRLGFVVDKRPAPAAVRAWRQEQERLASRGDKEWPPLPGTRVEAALLRRLVPRHTALVGLDATEEHLERLAEGGELKTFRLLHLATHGEANKGVPTQGALILAQHKTPDAYDNLARVAAGKLPLTNRLTVEAVLRTWYLDADLVTLSACETGLGAEAGGEGLLGFAQALLQKGARSVLLSRWKVDDAATSLLMMRFYRNALGQRDDRRPPMGRADALREAKDWLRRLTRLEAEALLARLTDGVELPRGYRGTVAKGLPQRKPDAPEGKADRPFDDPYFWAAFILLGDPD